MDVIYKENAKIVHHFLLSMCKDEHLAEELTQETFLCALQNIESFDGSCKLSTWLCQIGKHLLYQTWEKRKREVPMDLAGEEAQRVQKDQEIQRIHGVQETLDTEKYVLAKIELEEVLEELNKFPEAIREVIYLRVLSDLSYKEIGQIMGKSENWAKMVYLSTKALGDWEDFCRFPICLRQTRLR